MIAKDRCCRYAVPREQIQTRNRALGAGNNARGRPTISSCLFVRLVMTFDLSSRVSHDEDEDLQSPAQSVICNLSYSLVNQYI